MTTPAEKLGAALAGRYEIERELGQGGMATVYLAQDVRHHRKVALKVLRPELSAILGGERFLHEIRTTANLQHPHILPLYDSGEADGLVFYVMPFVAGESLRDRLARETQLPVDDAVGIAKEVADALDYAHRHGVIHRDIKPENILLHDGRAQVADFGIALAVSSAGGGTRMTETGMSLGTPHYMSPEQAMGEREISAKSDIYALGCVLYEMLVGEPPFTGPSAQAIIARVVTEEPRSLTAQRRSVSPELEAVVRRALEKLPADRFQSAAQFGAALASPGSVPLIPRRDAAAAARTTASQGSWRSRGSVPVLAALLVLATALAAWGWMRPAPAVVRPVVRFGLSLASNAGFSDSPGRSIAMSPAGDRFAYVGRNERGEQYLYVQSLDAGEALIVPDSRGAGSPFFSPDGLWLGFYADDKIRKVALAGGPVMTVTGVDSGFGGASWGTSQIIVVGTDFGLRQVPAAGGRLAPLTTLDSAREFSHRFPEFLPDGRTVLFQNRASDGVDRLAVVSLKDGRLERLEQIGTDPRYVESGHVLLGSLTGTVVAVPFDAARAEVTGPAIPVVDGVVVAQGGAVKMGVSRHGSMVYASGASGGVRAMVLVDRKGAVQPLTTELGKYGSPRYSPDGRTIALDIETGTTSSALMPGGSSSIWTFHLDQKTLTRLTFETDAIRPFWSPDGSRVAFTSRDDSAVAVGWVRADGSAPAERLLAPLGRRLLGDDFSRDGRTLVIHHSRPTPWRNDLMLVPLDSGGEVLPYLQTQFNEGAAAVSPDGKWLAYFSDESGRPEVYVRAFPNPGGKVQVSLSGGMEPRWSRDGRELFYRFGDQWMVAAVRTQPTFSVVGRAEMFRGRFRAQPYFAQYDVAPDGRHFVMLQSPTAPSDLFIVLNWFDQLRSKRGGVRALGSGGQ